MTFPVPLFDFLWNLVLILSVCASHLSACWQTPPGSCYSSILNFTWLATPPSSTYRTCSTVHIFQWMFLVRSIIKEENNLVHLFDPFKSFWRNYTFQSQRRLGSTRAPGQGLPCSWRMVVYIYYITAGILSACRTVGPPLICLPADRLLVPVTLVY